MTFKYLLSILLFSLSLHASSCWKIKNKDTKALCESKFNIKRTVGLLKIKILRLIVKPLHMDRIVAGRSKIMIHKPCVKQKYADKYETSYTEI